MNAGLALESAGILAACVIPALADLNATHATNPNWAPHARFHVVWQTLSYLLIAPVVLYVLWGADLPQSTRATLGGAFGLAVLGGFFAAVLSRNRYGGHLADANGYKPLRMRIGDRVVAIDVNACTFAVAAVLLIGGWALALAAGEPA